MGCLGCQIEYYAKRKTKNVRRSVRVGQVGDFRNCRMVINLAPAPTWGTSENSEWVTDSRPCGIYGIVVGVIVIVGVIVGVIGRVGNAFCPGGDSRGASSKRSS